NGYRPIGRYFDWLSNSLQIDQEPLAVLGAAESSQGTYVLVPVGFSHRNDPAYSGRLQRLGWIGHVLTSCTRGLYGPRLRPLRPDQRLPEVAQHGSEDQQPNNASNPEPSGTDRTNDGQMVGAPQREASDRIHATRENNAPPGRLIAQRHFSDHMPPETRGDQRRNQPRGECPADCGHACHQSAGGIDDGR